MYTPSAISPPAAQRGIVLVVALILLLILTLLGLAAAQSTSLQERMAGNARNQDIAFQSAEAGLSAAESCLNAGLALCTNFAADTAGAYQFNQAAPNNPWETAGFWNSAANYFTYDGVTGATLSGVSAQPEIIIEQMPPVAVPGGNIGQQQFGSGSPTIQLYRITVLGTGGDSTATIMLQGIYGS
ncbi:MAG: PilX N-terminal domain-containing pilus assembly protein [Gammaproteobacteria bacterium]